MPSRTLIVREEKSLPGFKASKDRLTLLLRVNADGTFKSQSQCSCTILKILGPFRTMLDLLCPYSVNATTKLGLYHISLQHSLLNILSPRLRPTAQKKRYLSKYYFSLTMHLFKEPWWRCTMRLMLLLCLLIQHPFWIHGSKSSFDFPVLLFKNYIL